MGRIERFAAEPFFVRSRRTVSIVKMAFLIGLLTVGVGRAEELAAAADVVWLEKPQRAGHFSLLGYGARSTNRDWVLSPETAVRYGEQVEMDLRIQVVEDVYLESARASVNFGDISEAFRFEVPAGPFSMIGAVVTEKIELTLAPRPTRYRPLPFLQASTYPVVLAIHHEHGGTLLSQSIATIEVGPIVEGDGVLCLTDNADLPRSQREPSVASVSFPDGPPTLNPSAVGTIETELTDGLFGTRGYPAWETVYWREGGGPRERRVTLAFTRPVHVAAVVAICPSAFPGYRVDELRVDVATGSGPFEGFGSANPFVDQHLLKVLVVRGGADEVERLQLTFAHDAGGTDLVVSEVYVFGK